MIEKIRFYAQKVLPLVYDNSLSYYEVLDKVVERLNEIISVTNELQHTVEVTVEQTLEEWYESGRLEEIIGETLDDITARVSAVEEELDGEGGIVDRVESLESDVSGLSGDLSALDNTVTGTNGIADRVTLLESGLGAANDDIDALESAIDGEGGIDERLTAAEGAIDDVDDRVDGVVDDIGSLDDRLDAIEAQIGNINPSDLSNKKMLLIGDSYNAGNGGVTGRGWAYYVQQYTGATCDIVHQNGGGFSVAGNANASYPNKTYAQLINSLASDAGYNIIVAQGGWNDASLNVNDSGSGGIRIGIEDFIDAAKTKYPDAEILIFGAYNDTYPSAVQQARLLTIPKTASANGIRTAYDSYLWMQNSGYNSADGVHLTNDGYKLLGYYVTAFLRGWDGTINFVKDITDVCGAVAQETSGVTHYANNRIVVDKNFCYINGDITLDGTKANWTAIYSSIPKPRYDCGNTIVQWSEEYTRPLRIEANATTGAVNVRYGAAGNYRMNMVYPIDFERDF